MRKSTQELFTNFMNDYLSALLCYLQIYQMCEASSLKLPFDIKVVADLAKFAADVGAKEEEQCQRAALCYRCCAVFWSKRYVANQKALHNKHQALQQQLSAALTSTGGNSKAKGNADTTAMLHQMEELMKEISQLADDLEKEIVSSLTAWKSAEDLLRAQTPMLERFDQHLLKIDLEAFIQYLEAQLKNMKQNTSSQNSNS